MELGKLVKNELSGSTTKKYVAELTEFHRIQASPMMHEAAKRVRERLRKIGVDKVTIERFPADGKRRYWTHTSTLGWTVRSAELRLLEPQPMLLVRFSDNPHSLHTLSKGTPKRGVIADLVDVGKGVTDKDYRGKRVRGRFVLATGQAARVQKQAVERRGALGVITDTLAYEYKNVRESKDVPDAHSYRGIWPNAKTAEKIGFGFSLSKRQGEILRRYLRSRKTVKLHAKVDARLSKGSYSIVNASIKGSSRADEEIFLVAHLCHPKPGANDNASGSGLLIEIARVITRLIKSGKMERPSRTLRFLWVAEMDGTAAFLEGHPEIYDKLVAGMNLDMVGEDQTLCKSTLTMTSTPDSLPSYLNDLVYSMIMRSNAEYDYMVKIGMVSNFRIARTPFSASSDQTEFNDSTVGAPCVAFAQWPDMFYHTNMDTMDKVSEDSLRRVGWAATMSALTLADADSRTVHELASLTSSEGMRRISDAVGKAVTELSQKGGQSRSAGRYSASMDLARFHKMRLEHIVRREVAAVRSLRRLDQEAGSDMVVRRQADAVAEHGSRELSRFKELIDTLQDSRRTAGARTKERPASEEEAMRIVPTKRFKGTLDSGFMVRRLGDNGYQWYRDADEKDLLFPEKRYEVVSMMDGKRNLWEITQVLSAEFGPTDPKAIVRFVNDLKAIGLASY